MMMYDAGEPKPLDPHRPRPFPQEYSSMKPGPIDVAPEHMSDEELLSSLRTELVGVAIREKGREIEREFDHFRLEDLISGFRKKEAEAPTGEAKRKVRDEWTASLYEALPPITVQDFPQGCSLADTQVYRERIKQYPLVEALGTLSQDFPNLRLFHVGQVMGPVVSYGVNYFVGDVKSALDDYTNTQHRFKHPPAPVISAVPLSEALTRERDGVVDVIKGEKATEVFILANATSKASEMSPQTIWPNTLLRYSYRFTQNPDQQQALVAAAQKAA